jgi:pSer/pThr/pTyr-binding forkhead associated (FHA) protein
MWGQLNIISGPDKGKMFPLFSTVITIGRGKDMEIYLPDDSNVVSTKHATISVAADGRLVFTDESTNGSKVDERAVHKSEVALTPDATIVIGPYELKLSVYEIPKTTAGEGGTVMLGEISKPSAATMQYLGRDLEVVEGGKDKGKKHCITAYETKIGRAPDQDFVLEDDFISRKHAAVHFSDGKWTVVNLSTSEQGTTVNGEKIKEAVELKPGDRIKLGKTVLEFKSISVD